LERCVKVLGGVGSFVGGYTNMGSANNVTYLDDPIKCPLSEESRGVGCLDLSPPSHAAPGPAKGVSRLQLPSCFTMGL